MYKHLPSNPATRGGTRPPVRRLADLLLPQPLPGLYKLDSVFEELAKQEHGPGTPQFVTVGGYLERCR